MRVTKKNYEAGTISEWDAEAEFSYISDSTGWFLDLPRFLCVPPKQREMPVSSGQAGIDDTDRLTVKVSKCPVRFVNSSGEINYWQKARWCC
jgi:hypothetical protein